MSSLLGAFFIQLGIITYRDVTQGGIKVPDTAPIKAPLPSQYLSAMLIYGVLGVMPASTAPLPGLIGWGLVVATMLNLWTPGAGGKATFSPTTASTATSANAQLAQNLTTPPPNYTPKS